jgi:hypothetical protein
MVGPPSLFAIQGDPEAMHYTYCSPSREATATRLEEYAARFAEDGFESWTAVLATEDRVVGWGGLNKDPGEPEWGPEIAYYFDWACWARGLATELVLESLAYGFDDRRHGRHCPSQLSQERFGHHLHQSYFLRFTVSVTLTRPLSRHSTLRSPTQPGGRSPFPPLLVSLR